MNTIFLATTVVLVVLFTLTIWVVHTVQLNQMNNVVEDLLLENQAMVELLQHEQDEQRYDCN